MGHRPPPPAAPDHRFQSTHPVRGGTYRQQADAEAKIFQSTHPVRGGTIITINNQQYPIISIHPPREGWDNESRHHTNHTNQFQSTHPVRGGTRVGRDYYRLDIFQSTHPVRGGTLQDRYLQRTVYISIHPPREGWDGRVQSLHYDGNSISIHPPREGWDLLPNPC